MTDNDFLVMLAFMLMLWSVEYAFSQFRRIRNEEASDRLYKLQLYILLVSAVIVMIAGSYVKFSSGGDPILGDTILKYGILGIVALTNLMLAIHARRIRAR
jgi:hypothetical protein